MLGSEKRNDWMQQHIWKFDPKLQKYNPLTGIPILPFS